MSSSRSTCSPGSSQDAPRGRMSSSTPRPVAWLARKTLAQHSHLAPSLQHGVPRLLGFHAAPCWSGWRWWGGCIRKTERRANRRLRSSTTPSRLRQGRVRGVRRVRRPGRRGQARARGRGTLWGWLLAGHPGVGRLLVLLVRVEEQDQHEADQRGEHGEQDGGRLAVDERLLGGGDELLGLGLGELLGDLLGAGERLADGRRRLLGQLLGLLWGGGRRTPW